MARRELLRINSISTLNIYNNLKKITMLKENSIQKISSGLGINKASDDTAGLVMVSKMKAQIRGLQQAMRNIQEGISMLQVMDGALNELTSYLQRMRELAIQASNGTLCDDDRKKIVLEVEQIKNGINDIANNTEFNTIKLLNKSRDSDIVAININKSNPDILMTKADFDYSNTLVFDGAVDAEGKFQFKTKDGYPATAADNNQILVYGDGSTSMPLVSIDGAAFGLRVLDITNTIREGDTYKTVYNVSFKKVEITQCVGIIKDKYEVKYTIKNNDSKVHNIGLQFHVDTQLGNDDAAPFIVNGAILENETKYTWDIPNSFVVYNQNTGSGANAEFQATGILKTTGDFAIIEEPSMFVVGNYSNTCNWDYAPSNSSTKITDSGYSVMWNSRSVSSGSSFEVNTFFGMSVPPTLEFPEDPVEPPPIENCGTYSLKIQVGANLNEFYIIRLFNSTIEGLKLHKVNLSAIESAKESIDKIQYVLNNVSSKKGEIGAHENALKYLCNNQENYQCNLTLSYSKIQDADIAREIMIFTKYSILGKVNLALSKQAKVNSESALKLLVHMSN